MASRSMRKRSVGGKLLTRSPDGFDHVQWKPAAGDIRTASPSRALLHESLHESEPVRIGAQYQNRRNQHGLYHWSRSKSHVWYESGFELACLIHLDFEGTALRIAAQPMRLVFQAGAGAVYHDPDFFAVHSNGDQVLYDIKPKHRMTDEVRKQFAETLRVCEHIGWRFEVLSEFSESRIANLDVIRACRLDRAHPPADTFEQIQNVFESSRSIEVGAAMINRRHPELAMPFIKHMIWHQFLSTDLDNTLEFSTVLTTTERISPCCV